MMTPEYSYEKVGSGEFPGYGIRLTAWHGSGNEVRIPAVLEGEEVTVIGKGCFNDGGLLVNRLILPPTVRLLESTSFGLCLNLTEVSLNEGLEVIEKDAFCVSSLSVLHIPKSVRLIEDPAGYELSFDVDAGNPYYLSDGYGLYRKEKGGLVLETVNPRDERAFYAFPEGTVSLREGALDGRSALESVFLPASLTSLPDMALVNAANPYTEQDGITSLAVDEDNPVFFLDDGNLMERQENGGIKLVRFLSRSLSYTPGPEVCDIAPYAFCRSSLRKITIPKTCRHFDPDAFAGSRVRKLVFEEQGFCIRFPKYRVHRLYDLLKNFGKNGQFYDFSAYDKYLTESTEPIDADQVRMMMSRLSDSGPVGRETGEAIRRKVSDHFEEVLGVIGKENDLASLRRMAELGFFTADNIDGAIGFFGRNGDREAMAALMEEKNRKFGFSEFDFSL